MKNGITATEINIRKRRANEITALFMRELLVFIAPKIQSEAYYTINNILEAMGAELITDECRRQIGLPPRDQNGWTADELIALEHSRLMALIKPLQINIPKPGDSGKDPE
ncbi:hypothetical protein RvVAR0630_17840 [Agrobacterium vitis]|uniref:hypothetical protein n=1 Tax=Rhizobium/Agrobacterium group TaxID=227290 RepID=UPI0015D95B13|nr:MULTISPECIES: hypothetical protein [Rhizobium/Agrobacterium group]MCF1471163.1 hypothetical protein [Allorhizobium ampelinum]BCH59160.1 hypothetical protein RvVAR0630_17840 [Agrobacterium vitis]